MKEKSLVEKWPSLYDYFYYDYWIINCLYELESIKNFFNKYNFNFNYVYYGYLYFLELSIINIINHLESIVGDLDIYELIRWGNVTKDNEKFAEIIKSHPEGKFIFDLDSIRRKSSKCRFKNECNEKEIIHILIDLKDILTNLNKSIMISLEVSKLKTFEEKEESLLLNWILTKYNWIELSSNNFTSDEYNIIPEWPGNPIFYLMPPNTRQAYYLQNSRIKINEINYLKGFSLTLLYLYNNLLPHQINSINNDILNVKDWLELHKVGGQIHEKTIHGQDILIKLFDVNHESKKNFFKKNRIENYEKLRLVFKGRTIRTIFNRLPGDHSNRESLFVHFLFGAISMYEFDIRNKPEIIEFKNTFKNGNQNEYSYAIYIPVGSAFGDSSNWIFFDKLCMENDWEPTSYFKIQIDDYIKIFKDKDLISFNRYDINKKILAKYIKENDFEIKAKKDEKDRFNECIGLLGEFFAGFYLLKDHNITNLSKLDFHRDIEDTDIDVIGENEDYIIIFQAKTSMSFDTNVHKEILDNFSKILDNIKNETKTILKILFITKDNIPEREILRLLEDEEILERGVISNYDIEKRKQEIIDFFETNNIKTKFLKDLIYMLKSEGTYNGFLEKLNFILPENESEEDEE